MPQGGRALEVNSLRVIFEIDGSSPFQRTVRRRSPIYTLIPRLVQKGGTYQLLILPTASHTISAMRNRMTMLTTRSSLYSLGPVIG
jgi:hypothetical protein